MVSQNIPTRAVDASQTPPNAAFVPLSPPYTAMPAEARRWLQALSSSRTSGVSKGTAVHIRAGNHMSFGVHRPNGSCTATLDIRDRTRYSAVTSDLTRWYSVGGAVGQLR